MWNVCSLQAQIATMKGGGDSTKYKHNQQLEELRNLQDRLTAEKSAWNTTRDQEAKELEEKKAELMKLQVRIYCVLSVTWFFNVKCFAGTN